MRGTGSRPRPAGGAAGSGPAWRVFVSLRDAPGLFERHVRAPGALEAEELVSNADGRVLETLGAELDGEVQVDPSDEPVYRPLQATGRRFLRLRAGRARPLGVPAPPGSPTPAPFAEILTPKP